MLFIFDIAILCIKNEKMNFTCNVNNKKYFMFIEATILKLFNESYTVN